jgi:hypothetical protein
MSSVPYIFAGNTGNIPLAQLDDNFANVKLSVDYVIQPVQANIITLGTLSNLSVSGNVVVGRNALISGNLSVTGNTIYGNIRTAGFISAAGNILSNSSISATGSLFASANVRANGLISATGNISTANNIFSAGVISATGTLQSDTSVLVNGFVSASGNILGNVANVRQVNARFVSVSQDLFVQGNATVSGTTTFINTTNLEVTDKNIIIANGVSTSAQIDGAGIDAGNPTVAYIRYSHASLGWTTANNFSVGANLSVTGTTTLTGVPTAPTPANATANTQIATTQFVQNVIVNALPTGVILMWSGSIVSIPTGWFLCNGANGTPDLRDRFIVGAGSTYSVAATGGSANATLVSHTHTVTDPGHTHNSVGNGAPNGGGAGIALTNPGNSPGLAIESASTGISLSTEGSSATNANLPPYYALAYIMKS